jgi:hypothetical protein
MDGSHRIPNLAFGTLHKSVCSRVSRGSQTPPPDNDSYLVDIRRRARFQKSCTCALGTVPIVEPDSGLSTRVIKGLYSSAPGAPGSVMTGHIRDPAAAPWPVTISRNSRLKRTARGPWTRTRSCCTDDCHATVGTARTGCTDDPRRMLANRLDRSRGPDYRTGSAHRVQHASTGRL